MQSHRGSKEGFGFHQCPEMKEVSTSNFGLVIAYLLPGFVTLIGVSFFSETVRIWLTISPSDAPTVGGFLYVTIASVALGMTVGSVRWLVIDTIHHKTGIQQPQWDFSRLQENINAYRTLVEIHYHFYLFFAEVLRAALVRRSFFIQMTATAVLPA